MPGRFDDQSALSFLPLLRSARHEPNVLLDFSRVSFVLPFATLIVCVALREFLLHRKQNGYVTESYIPLGPSALSYLDYFGFFRVLGIRASSGHAASLGSNRYLPITKINRAALREDKNGRFQPAVDKESDRLANVVCAGDEAAKLMLSYCFREIIRNSFEHGEVSTCLAMAQRWDDGVVEMALADRGIGIPAALAKAHSVGPAHEAIRLAMRPGITSAALQAKGDDWDNSGFGLYVISELGRRYGETSIASGGAVVVVNQTTESAGSADVRGTIVKLKVNTADAEFWPNILRRIVEQGEAEAATIPGALHVASKKSRSAR